jgi:hypothetical protein
MLMGSSRQNDEGRARQRLVAVRAPTRSTHRDSPVSAAGGCGSPVAGGAPRWNGAAPKLRAASSGNCAGTSCRIAACSFRPGWRAGRRSWLLSSGLQRAPDVRIEGALRVMRIGLCWPGSCPRALRGRPDFQVLRPATTTCLVSDTRSPAALAAAEPASIGYGAGGSLGSVASRCGCVLLPFPPAIAGGCVGRCAMSPACWAHSFSASTFARPSSITEAPTAPDVEGMLAVCAPSC